VGEDDEEVTEAGAGRVTTRTETTREEGDAETTEVTTGEEEVEAGEEVAEEGTTERCRFATFATSTCAKTRRRPRRNGGTRSTKRKTKRRSLIGTLEITGTTRMNARGTIREFWWKL
jgi:hypothetical protein